MRNIEFLIFVFDFELLWNRIFCEIFFFFNQQHRVLCSWNNDFDIFRLFAHVKFYIAQILLKIIDLSIYTCYCRSSNTGKCSWLVRQPKKSSDVSRLNRLYLRAIDYFDLRDDGIEFKIELFAVIDRNRVAFAFYRATTLKNEDFCNWVIFYQLMKWYELAGPFQLANPSFLLHFQ